MRCGLCGGDFMYFDKEYEWMNQVVFTKTNAKHFNIIAKINGSLKFVYFV